MRTTLNLPDDLLNEARALLRFESKTDTVILALQELVRRKKIEQLKGLAGKVRLHVNVESSRRRASSTRRGKASR